MILSFIGYDLMYVLCAATCKIGFVGIGIRSGSGKWIFVPEV